MKGILWRNIAGIVPCLAGIVPCLAGFDAGQTGDRKFSLPSNTFIPRGHIVKLSGGLSKGEIYKDICLVEFVLSEFMKAGECLCFH